MTILLLDRQFSAGITAVLNQEYKEIERSKVTRFADPPVASLVRRSSRSVAIASANMLGFVPQRRTL